MESDGKDNFIDLASYRKIDASRKPRGNIVKASRIIMEGVEQVGTPGDGEDQPTVVFHRVDDKIVSIEFSCKCGRSALVSIDYEQE